MTAPDTSQLDMLTDAELVSYLQTRGWRMLVTRMCNTHDEPAPDVSGFDLCWYARWGGHLGCRIAEDVQLLRLPAR